MKWIALFYFLLPVIFLESGPYPVVLVLGSGGSKGLAHVGVIEELENLGIVPDVIVGCSSGAIVGALYAQHGNIAKVKQQLLSLEQKDLIDFSLFEEAAFSSRKKLKKFLKKKLKVADFSEMKIQLILVATDLDRGKPVYFSEGNVHRAVLASSSLPGLYSPYLIEKTRYVDGGLSDPLPIHFARSLGEGFIIASDISASLDGFDSDNVFQVLRKSFEVTYQRLAHFHREEADCLLEMSFPDIDSPIEDGLNQRIYERGKEVTRNHATEILNKLSMKSTGSLSER